MNPQLLEIATAAITALAVFLLLLYVMRRGGGPAVSVALPPPPRPKNPIGFCLPA